MARNPLTPYRGGSLFGGGADPLFSLHREMNRLFDEVMGGGMPMQGGQGAGQILNAQMNVSETESEIRIEAEMPGVSEQDIDVQLNDDVLTIRGEKRFERKDNKENYHFVERSFGTFQRSLRLPFAVDPEQVQASFENGVLTVTLPKSARAERTRKIQVQRGAGGSPGQIGQQGGGQSGGQQGGQTMQDQSDRSGGQRGQGERGSAEGGQQQGGKG